VILFSRDNGSAGLTFDQTYKGLLRDYQDCTIYTDAIAGSSISNVGLGNEFTKAGRFDTLDSVISPDVILVFGGVNDFLEAVPLGDINTPLTDRTKFYGAVRYLYSQLINLYPNAHIYQMTPCHNQYDGGGAFTPQIPEFNSVSNSYLQDYINAERELADLYGIGLIETYRESGITAGNISSMSTDDIHFNEVGHKLVYELIIKTLSQ